MHRPWSLRASRAWLLIGLIAASMTTAAASLAQSPSVGVEAPTPSFVGAWVLVDETDLGAPPSTITVQADGTLTYLQLDGPYSGVWRSITDDTALVTMVSTRPDGVLTIRAHVTLAPDGDTLTAEYTLEPHCLCGDTLGQLGPGAVSGTRIHVDAPGEPVGPMQPPVPSPEAQHPEPAPSPA